MYGHIGRPEHWIRHMDLLRGIQHRTGGFTEFVPLSLIHSEAPMYQRGLVPGVRPGATGLEVIKMHALARLMLGPTFRNIQCSWVKEGPKLSQQLLTCGANDLGGTLINESISTSAGAGPPPPGRAGGPARGDAPPPAAPPSTTSSRYTRPRTMTTSRRSTTSPTRRRASVPIAVSPRRHSSVSSTP